MKMHREDPFATRDSWKTILAVMIPALATGSGLLWIGRETGSGFAAHLGHVIIITSGLWMFCRSYVQFLWIRYPWDTHPVIHIVLEVLGIGLFSFVYGTLLYRVELRMEVMDPVPRGDLWLQVLLTLLITYLITGIHEMVYFYKQWIYNFSRSVRLERDSMEAKYETLKTQVNPHFLFNSLNSLVTLVDDNPKAVDYVQNLSEFLRYMLGSRKKDLAYLRDEVRVLGHYVELQKSRFQENFQVETGIPEKYDLYTLPPLVLQMLVENCIKHNVISRERPLKIRLTADRETLTVTNNLQKKTGVDSTGQGLANIIERYRFFTAREVRIRETDTEFSVSVPLLIVEL